MAQFGVVILAALIGTTFCSPLHFEKKQDRLKNKEGIVSVTSAKNNQGTESAVSGIRVPVAFSAYLTEGIKLKVLKVNQTLVFDKVLINVGDGYDTSTGVFTVPISGVYSFTYFIASRGEKQQNFAVLTLDGKVMSEAAAETIGVFDDSQGGNNSIFHATKGQKVEVKFIYGDGYIVGWEDYRVTTFSGHLLFVL